MVEIVPVTKADRQRWNAFVAEAPSFSLMQSYEWGEFKERLGWQAIRVAVERRGQIVAGAQMLIRPLFSGLISVAYVPRGPLTDWEDIEATTALLDSLHQEAGHHRAILLRIEPPLANDLAHHDRLQFCGFRLSTHTNQPRYSIVVNLLANMDELLMALPSSTRYNIRLSRRKGVTVHTASAGDLPTFYQLLKITAKRGGFPIRSLKYYRQEWLTFSRLGQVRFFLAQCNGKTIAVQMPFCFGEHAATFHAGSTDEHRRLKAGYLLMWESMCWARSQGCRTFDLWGIPDEVGELKSRGEPIPQGCKEGLWGVYYFKHAFRGEVVYYVGAYDDVYSRPLHRAMEFITASLGSLDKLAQWGDRLI